MKKGHQIEQTIFTHTRRSAFLRCQQLQAWRYEYNIVPIEKRAVLAFGSTIHDCLEYWHQYGDPELVRFIIDSTYPERQMNEKQKGQWHLAHAMMRGYQNRYATEPFRVIEAEKIIEGKIINPATGHCARAVLFRGRVDALVQKIEDIKCGNTDTHPDTYWLVEHKTSSGLSNGYTQAIWEDPQIFLYATYLEQQLGITITGVIYNVLVKSKISQKREETELEFEQRRAALIAKSKTGKSNAQRQLGESDEDFRARLDTIYAADGTTGAPSMFYRQEVLLDDRRRTDAMSELWWTAQSYLAARRSGHWLKNRQQCHAYNTQCDYWTLCFAHPEEIDDLIMTYYQRKDPHTELEEKVDWKRLFDESVASESDAEGFVF